MRRRKLNEARHAKRVRRWQGLPYGQADGEAESVTKAYVW